MAIVPLDDLPSNLRGQAVPEDDLPGGAPAEGRKKSTVGSELVRGGKQLVSSVQTAAESLFGTPEEAALAGLERGRKISEEAGEGASLEAVKRAYEKEGLLSAAGEVVSQIPRALAGQGAQLASMAALGKAGAMAGTAVAPGPGTVIGGVLGAGAALLPQFLGSNVERQVQEQIESGQAPKVDLGKAGAAAAGQAAIEGAGTAFVLGKRVVKGFLGIADDAALATNKARAEMVKAAERSLLAASGRGAVRGTAEIPVEVAQQVIERYQAGLDVTSPDALEEYGEAAYQAALVGGTMGAVAGPVDTAFARQATKESDRILAEEEKQRAEAEAAEKAKIPPLALGMEEPFKPVVFPDGSVATTPEDVARYEEQQFQKKYAPQEADKPKPLAIGVSEPFKPVVFPDGSVATTPEDVVRYEEEQFKKKYAPQPIAAAPEPEPLGKSLARPRASTLIGGETKAGGELAAILRARREEQEAKAEVPVSGPWEFLFKQRENLRAEPKSKERDTLIGRIDEELLKLGTARIEQERKDREMAKTSVFGQEQLPPMESRGAVVAERDLAEMQAREGTPELTDFELAQAKRTARMAGKPFVDETVQAERDAQMKQLRELKAERNKIQKGGNLYKMLEGQLDPSEVSDISPDIKKLYGKGYKPLEKAEGQGSFISELVENKILDDFLPVNMRPESATFDVQQSTEYIKDKLRNKETAAEVSSEEARKLDAQISNLMDQMDEPTRREAALLEAEELRRAERAEALTAEATPEVEALRRDAEAAGIDVSAISEAAFEEARDEGLDFDTVLAERLSDALGSPRLYDIAAASGKEKKRNPSFSRTVAKYKRDLDAGKISQGQFVFEVDLALKRAEEARETTEPRQRTRGADYIRQRLLEAKRRGDLSEEAVDFAEWFIQRNPDLVEDLGISIRQAKEEGVAGEYNALAKIMRLIKESENDTTVVHEILHHLERMMPEKVRSAIRSAWAKQMSKAADAAKTDKEKQFFKLLTDYHFGGASQLDFKAAVQMIKDGDIDYSNYQYTNPSEFWAVNGSEIMKGRFDAVRGGVLARLKNWLKEFAEKIKSAFGFKSDAAIIRALDSLSKGDGKFVTSDMLSEGVYRDIAKPKAQPAEEAPKVPVTRQNIFGEPVLGTWNIQTDPNVEIQDGLIYKLLDKNVDVKRIVQAVKSTGKQIASALNPYLQEELYHGRVANAIAEFKDKEMTPLLKDMDRLGVTIGQLEQYLLNRHAPDYNRIVAERNPDRPEMQDGGSSVKTEDARKYMASLDPETKAKYEELAARIDRITKGTRQLLADTGYEKAETIKGWEEAFPFYVPLMREEGDFDYNFGSFGTGRGFDVRRDFSRSAMGSKRNVVDIIGNVIAARNNAIMLTEKNRVAQAVYGLALEAPNPDFWLPINPDLAEVRQVDRINQNIAKLMAKKSKPDLTDEDLAGVKADLESEYKKLKVAKDKALEAIEKAKKELVDFGVPADAINAVMREPEQRVLDPKKQQVTSRINTKLRENDYVLATRINGERRYVFFNPKDERAKRAAKALKNLDAQDLGTALGMVATATRWMASVNTQYNPIFGPYNFLRDVQGAALQLSTTPLAGMQKEVGKNIVPALRVIYSSLRKRRKGEKVDGELADLWKEFQKEGGQTGFRDNFSRTQDRTEALIKELNRIQEGKVMGTARAMFDWLSDYNDSLENATRLAAYKVAKEKFLKEGMDLDEAKQQAASVAKNLTVNFNRKGDVATQVGALYAFFNASMQGTARMIETLKGPAGKKIIAGGLLLGAIQAAMFAAAGFDEEEPRQFIRERNIVIPTWDGKYIAFPMPLGFHVIPNFSRIITEWTLSGFKDTADRVADLTGLFLDAFNPVGNAGWSAQTFSPTVADPFVAIFENKDWTGKPISREDIFSLRPTPGYTRAREGANLLATELAKFLNYASGGTQDTKGVLSPTPEQIEYLVGQVFGGVGREATKLATSIEKTITGEELPPYKIPLYGRFVGETKSSAAESNRFYKNMQELNELNEIVKGRRRRNEPLGDFMRENPEARLLPMANRTYNDIQKLRDRREALVERGAPREAVKQVEMQITRRMQMLNDRVAALKD